MECWLWAEKVHGTADVAIEELSLPIIGEGVSSCIIGEREILIAGLAVSLECNVGYWH